MWISTPIVQIKTIWIIVSDSCILGFRELKGVLLLSLQWKEFNQLQIIWLFLNYQRAEVTVPTSKESSQLQGEMRDEHVLTWGTHNQTLIRRAPLESMTIGEGQVCPGETMWKPGGYGKLEKSWMSVLNKPNRHSQERLERALKNLHCGDGPWEGSNSHKRGARNSIKILLI